MSLAVVAIFYTECRGDAKGGERTATGDSEIFNSLLIKANFLWLSLPGNPLGGFSSDGGGGGDSGGSNGGTNLRFPIPRCAAALI